MSIDRVGPERRRETPLADAALTTPSANEIVLRDALNSVLALLRDAGFIPR